MTKSLLWGFAGLCFFIAAGITYFNDSRPLIVIMQAVAGLLLLVVALRFTRKA